MNGFNIEVSPVAHEAPLRRFNLFVVIDECEMVAPPSNVEALLCAHKNNVEDAT